MAKTINVQQPLTQEHCTTLDCVLQRLEELKTLIDKCQNAGLDVSQAYAEYNRQKQLAEQLKRVFFPHNP